jgi:hypothetical protein
MVAVFPDGVALREQTGKMLDVPCPVPGEAVPNHLSFIITSHVTAAGRAAADNSLDDRD